MWSSSSTSSTCCMARDTGFWSVNGVPSKSASKTGRVMRCWASISMASCFGDGVVQVVAEFGEEVVEGFAGVRCPVLARMPVMRVMWCLAISAMFWPSLPNIPGCRIS